MARRLRRVGGTHAEAATTAVAAVTIMAPSLPPTVPEHNSGDSLASPLPPPPPMAGRILYNPYSSSKKKPSQQQQQQPPPQKKPFLGGAEMARRNARKKTATRIWRPGEQQQSRKKEQDSEELPKNMNIYDRFFGALLRSSASEFHKAASSNGGGAEAASDVVWHALCRRLGLAHMIPQQPIASTYHDAKVHFGVRAALVLEEARESISAALVQRWKQQKSRANGGSNSGRHRSIATVLHFIEGKSRHTGLAVVRFRKMSPLSREELFHVRPGSMFECVPRDNPNLANVVLGVVSSSNRDEAENKHIVSLLVLSGDTVCEGRDEWLVTPLCSLISELRQFEACTRAWSETNLPFLRSILGGSAVAKGTHVRFESESDEEKENEVRIKKELKDDDHHDEEEEDADKVKKEDDDDEEDDDDDIQVVAPPGHIAENAFSLPTLNKTQERAASTFLNSAPSTVTIIQGPPGTGKTTLLISIICRYLLESTNNQKAHPRLLVCAPTNKAITVLATRFLQATKNSVAFNTVLVGDADKLLIDERSAKETSSMTTKLRSIFVYQWIPAILDEYLSIRKFVDGKNDDNRNDPQMCREMVEKAQTLQQKLARSLCGLPLDVLENTISICNTLLQWTTSPTTPVAKTLVKKIDQLIADLKTLIPEAIYKELVSTAHVLFCTLASAGGMVIKSTNPVHDLIVDEAAAATEPDLYIPFHLSPHRLLVVGDPLQLPATVLSRRAIELGLSKSLHERLMYDCKHEHIMLDVQYRMKPDISSFPSHRFYKGMLTNGENVQRYLLSE